ncbi:citrulline utilization hydrolase CtlX [Mucilaginibacter aquaedulcis]|uniref:citrulline utilization hydrolase CtlX n=1 Tax=Mucilaginibacter aquaedulcis TaxID=1187081 RepID=UPI0025B3792E|nr:arginine deiminase-related protein [Mucilaginibacter aquaedulcis]MDN3546791.1 arginine deiminase-related protein [Mucilaginibacter aquaedulcis]
MTNQQSTSNILMIRPVSFGFNEQTAASNAFQNRAADQQSVQDKALAEFDGFVKILTDNGINVTVVDDTLHPHTPDSIFPNNWVSFHEDGGIFLYPMQAENRRLERREDIISKLEDSFKVGHIIDLSRFEHDHKFLEGTGSMVLDRENKIAYACLSPRTDKETLNLFCEQAGYQPISFEASDAQGKDIYHTNVLMCIGSHFAVICADSIPNPHEKVVVLESLRSTHKELVTITFDQMNRFAGNMLELKNKAGENLIIMSKNAYQVLNEDQRSVLEKYGKLIYADINNIETNGGGSARCMIAEVHLPELN